MDFTFKQCLTCTLLSFYTVFDMHFHALYFLLIQCSTYTFMDFTFKQCSTCTLLSFYTVFDMSPLTLLSNSVRHALLRTLLSNSVRHAPSCTLLSNSVRHALYFLFIQCSTSTLLSFQTVFHMHFHALYFLFNSVRHTPSWTVLLNSVRHALLRTLLSVFDIHLHRLYFQTVFDMHFYSFYFQCSTTLSRTLLL